MISGLAIANFRSFGEERQLLVPTSQINIIIGKNNSGKSNILRVIEGFLPAFANGQPTWNPILDASKYSKGQQETTIDLFLPKERVEAHFSSIAQGRLEGAADAARLVLHSIQQTPLNGYWVRRQRLGEGWKERLLSSDTNELLAAFNRENLDLQDICMQLFSISSFDESENVNALVRTCSPFKLNSRIVLVPATRSLKFLPYPGSTPKGDFVYNGNSVDLSGIGLIERLFKLQAPDVGEHAEGRKFDDLTSFVRSITGDPAAKIQVPHNRSTINLTLNGRTLPLQSYGSGIEQAIIVAACATTFDKDILCIEEPETNLHPEFQSKLVSFLRDKTNNQYFITTHSGRIIDTEGASVYHVDLTTRGSIIRKLLDPSDRYDVIFDLGYRASDLAQCNCVIWVEGPTDRLLLNFALKQAASDLVEGVHYSIMFYGGRLLSHLTINDEQIEEFIQLSRINQRSAVMIDSDRSTPEDELAKTKLRVQKEFSARGLFCWVTIGREIENYVDPGHFRTALGVVHSGMTLQADGQFADFGVAEDRGGESKPVNKVKVVHELCQNEDLRFRFDWHERMQECISFIRKSN